MPWIETANGACLLRVRVVPRASRDEVAGPLGDALKIRITAPPVDGKANAHLTRWLARTLDLPPTAVTLTAGSTARTKRIHIQGLTPDAIRSTLLAGRARKRWPP
jgi:uncharacterized protein (TIGR00251 family)